MSRRAGKVAGVVTLILDALKGAAAIFIGKLILGPSVLTSSVDSGGWAIAGAAILVIIGHMFPVWLGFRGGKGVATGVGVFLVLAPFAVLGAGAVFFVIVFATRYVSLGSIVAASTIPLFVWLQHGLIKPVEAFWRVLVAAVFMAALIVFAHRGNIGRLLRGTETKFG